MRRTLPTLLMFPWIAGAAATDDCQSCFGGGTVPLPGGGGGAPTVPVGPPMNGLFTPQVTDVVVEVDYQAGAAPFTGRTIGRGEIWDLFEANAQALFAAAPKTLHVDRALGDMERIDGITDTDFTAAEILDLAARHRSVGDTASVRTFYVLFLNGYYDDGGRQTSTLGVSLGGTTVIAMFKPVIGFSSTDGVEQATLIHEFGHAVGLTDNGLPMVGGAHDDPAHGAHCANPDCVMYWQVAGASIHDFARNRIRSGRSILFDAECLADARDAASP